MIFLTGTDTGCGKTTVGRAIAAALRRRQIKVGVFKPVETGCEVDESGALTGADGRALSLAAGLALPHKLVCPVRLRLPASPERAAEAEGRAPVTLGELIPPFEAVAGASDFVIVEGAGGLLVPISPSLMMIDLPEHLSLPVVVVSRDALGTVNHTLLSLEALRARALEPLGVLFTSVAPEESGLDNVETITRLGQIRSLGRLPFLPEATDETLATAAEEHLDLDRIVSGSS